MTPSDPEHRPVLGAEVLEVLRPAAHELIVDGTFGLGGHSLALLRHDRESRLLGIERDPWVLDRGRQRLLAQLPEAASRVELVHASFADLERLLDDRGLSRYQAGLLDLGLNSLQIDAAGRGFSREDAALDLRFDTTDPMTADAATLLAEWPETPLADALYELGGERLSRPIARALVRRREQSRPVTTASELAALVAGIYQRHGIRRQRIHPVTRTMQALRIAVNDEFGHIRRGLAAFLRRLDIGGRLAVIAFHSGEARLVKQAFTAAVKGTGESLAARRFEWVTKGVLKPGPAEVGANPRARSAQMRALRRTA